MASAAPRESGCRPVDLPTFKGRPGWEFTDISGLDLAAYERVGANVDGAAGAEPLWELRAPALPDGVIVGRSTRPSTRR